MKKTERIYTSFIKVDFSCVSFKMQRVISNKLEIFTEISMEDLVQPIPNLAYLCIT